ncbi:GNAT family N-acetyltransferase [uncultured Tateyamaria sp.]|uniref:GNAT family N-acetyltransferase n=1 Tax=Tateyamaria sp. 1078 TaxID=3417464 RepID=UPI002629039D|nr:GNAT family N-acetyltransferase [uncultured Tateyamaria sp.]
MTDPAPLLDAIEATWPPARTMREGPWTIRDGAGGGKRVSAATAEAPVTADDIATAEAAMLALDQPRLFMLRPDEAALDRQLADRGYEVIDPVNLYVAPVELLTDVPIPRVTAFAIWEPLAIMAEIWETGGIGPARLDVMHRAAVKTGILARHADKPAGAGFVALHGGIAMAHAVEVLPHQRRKGVAQWIMRRAAFWAAEQGADRLAVLCTAANGPANALYQRLGFSALTGYHYRIHPEDT